MSFNHIEINTSIHSELIDQVFDRPVRIIINRGSLRGDRAYFRIYRCVFKSEVSLSVSNDLVGKKSISFIGCFIDSISSSLIDYKNFSLTFFSCVVTNFTGGNKVKYNLNINNSLGNFFITNCNRLNISFTEENIYPRVWEKIEKIIPNLFGVVTRFHVDNSVNSNFYCNLFLPSKNKEIGLLRRRGEVVPDYRVSYFPKLSDLELLNISFDLNFGHLFKNDGTNIKSFNLNNLTLSGETNGKLGINNCKINNVFIHNFSPQKEFKFFQIEPKNNQSKFEIHESNLENTWFDNVSLNRYAIVSLYKSNLSSVKFTSTTFPSVSTDFSSFKSLENIHYPDAKSDSYYKDQYELFLQLRLALLNTGNTYEAQKMQSIAYSSLKKVDSVGPGDKFILWLNRNSNLHGIEPFRAFCWALGISIFLYCFYLNSLGLLFGKSINWNLFANYFSFLDLTHKSNFLVEKSKLSSEAIIIDFTNKIVIGYLIYQFIAGFRKFGK